MTTYEFAPVAQLFSDQERQDLVSTGAIVSDSYWAWGDLANQKTREARLQYGLERPGVVLSVYDYIASLVGKSRRSIQYYAEVAAFFPPEIREAYHPLRFDTFKQAREYGPRWRDVLDLALNYWDNHTGRLPTREWLEHGLQPITAEMGEQMAAETPFPDQEWNLTPNSLADLTRAGALIGDPSRAVTLAAEATIKMLHQAMLGVQPFVAALTVREETRREINEAMAHLGEILERAQREIFSR